jgi:AAA domain-containing protein
MAEQEKASVESGFPCELLSQPIAARYDYFDKKVIAHPLLKEAYDKLIRTIYQPAGASLIWAIGPTGVGKTTLLRKTVNQLIEDAMKDMERDPGYFPVAHFGLQDVSTERGSFDWKDFFKRYLQALNEPLIERKIDYASLTGPLQKSLRRTSTLADLRGAAKECVHHRRPIAVMIDEAQHFKKVGSGRRLLDQMDSIKALAETTGIPHVLIGTYELLDLTNLSGQLSRRSSHIYLPRYQCEKQGDIEAFINMLMMFQCHLPLLREPNLVDRYEYFYDRCVGCIGVLKNWLCRALNEALENNEKTLTKKCLKNHEKSTLELMNMVREISQGEGSLKVKPKDLSELRRLLGWKTVAPGEKEKQKTGAVGSEQREQVGEENQDNQQADAQTGLQTQKSAPKQPKPKQKKNGVGRRNPKRDPVGHKDEEE